MIDRAKRKTLKTIALSGMGVGASMYLPAAFARGELTASDATSLPESGLTLTHYLNYNGHTVLVHNSTASDITLRNISPGVVKTPAGGFDLQNILRRENLTVPANSTQAVSIEPNGTVNRYALWRHIERSQAVADTTSRYRSMQVAGRYDLTDGPTIVRSHVATVA